MGLKILHIWMSADVAVTMSKELKRRGHNVRILMNKNADPFKWREAAPDIVRTTKSDRTLFLKVMKEIFFFRPNIVHVHGMLSIAKWVRYVYKKIPLVMHFHGSDIREVWHVRMPELKKLNFSAIIVSSEDLMRGAPEEGVFYIPNPVDDELFTRTIEGNNNKALFISINEDQGPAEERAKEYAKNVLKMELDIIYRPTNPIPYLELRDLLQQYAVYIDYKVDGMVVFFGSKEVFDEIRKSFWCYDLSLTALQAISLGLVAIDYKDVEHSELPEDRTPAYAVDLLEEIYYNVLENQ